MLGNEGRVILRTIFFGKFCSWTVRPTKSSTSHFVTDCPSRTFHVISLGASWKVGVDRCHNCQSCVWHICMLACTSPLSLSLMSLSCLGRFCKRFTKAGKMTMGRTQHLPSSSSRTLTVATNRAIPQL
jgi:hypothetical protein